MQGPGVKDSGFKASKGEESWSEIRAEHRTDTALSPLSDIVLGAVFLFGGVYMIFAFSSFWVFVIGFFCVVLGVSMALGGLRESGIKSGLRVLDNSPRSPEAEAALLRVLSQRGATSPAEAAVEASLSVRETDSTLSELASRGYLKVESGDGTLFYSIPGLGARSGARDSLEDS